MLGQRRSKKRTTIRRGAWSSLSGGRRLDGGLSEPPLKRSDEDLQDRWTDWDSQSSDGDWEETSSGRSSVKSQVSKKGSTATVLPELAQRERSEAEAQVQPSAGGVTVVKVVLPKYPGMAKPVQAEKAVEQIEQVKDALLQTAPFKIPKVAAALARRAEIEEDMLTLREISRNRTWTSAESRWWMKALSELNKLRSTVDIRGTVPSLHGQSESSTYSVTALVKTPPKSAADSQASPVSSSTLSATPATSSQVGSKLTAMSKRELKRYEKKARPHQIAVDDVTIGVMKTQPPKGAKSAVTAAQCTSSHAQTNPPATRNSEAQVDIKVEIPVKSAPVKKPRKLPQAKGASTRKTMDTAREEGREVVVEEKIYELPVKAKAAATFIPERAPLSRRRQQRGVVEADVELVYYLKLEAAFLVRDSALELTLKNKATRFLERFDTSHLSGRNGTRWSYRPSPLPWTLMRMRTLSDSTLRTRIRLTCGTRRPSWLRKAWSVRLGAFPAERRSLFLDLK